MTSSFLSSFLLFLEYIQSAERRHKTALLRRRGATWLLGGLMVHKATLLRGGVSFWGAASEQQEPVTEALLPPVAPGARPWAVQPAGAPLPSQRDLFQENFNLDQNLSRGEISENLLLFLSRNLFLGPCLFLLSRVGGQDGGGSSHFDMLSPGILVHLNSGEGWFLADCWGFCALCFLGRREGWLLRKGQCGRGPVGTGAPLTPNPNPH